LISFWFGFATFAGACLNTAILAFILPKKLENNWSVRHEIMLYALHFFTISVFNYLLAAYLLRFTESFSVWPFLSVVSSTLLVGLIPVSIHVLQQQKKLYQNNYELAAQLNQKLLEGDSKEKNDPLDLNNNKISVDELVYVESRKNYVFLCLSNAEDLTVRMTLKKMESKLEKYEHLVRCHRAFIVNLDKVTKVEGNAQGLKLYLLNSSNFVPVSRSYITKINRLIHAV